MKNSICGTDFSIGLAGLVVKDGGEAVDDRLTEHCVRTKCFR